jgi:hypothetical protein
MGFKDSIVYAASDNGIWRSFFTPPNFSWSKPSVIYDESIRDQIRTNLFYSVASQGDSVWVGSGDGLARTTDTLSSPWVGKLKIFRAYKNITSTNESYAAPNPFSPDYEVQDIFQDRKTTANVTIKLFDFAMFPVRTVIQTLTAHHLMLYGLPDGKRDDGTVFQRSLFLPLEIDKDETVWGKVLFCNKHMKGYLLILCFLFLASSISNGCSAISGGKGEYSKIVSFSKNEKIQFPDFVLEYIGERSEKKEFPNGNSFTFRFYDFIISSSAETKTISWSSGTGLIDPLPLSSGQ